ncbi:hypothetical protein CDEF62S_05548 [Castellaniella defragrans]
MSSAYDAAGFLASAERPGCTHAPTHHVYVQTRGTACARPPGCCQELDVRGDEEALGLGSRNPARERHGFGGGRRLIQQGRVGDVQTSEIRHQRLENQQGFQTALGNLGLVRRVGRVPGRILQNVAQDHVRHVGAVIALPDVAAQHLVAGGHRLQVGQRLDFFHRTGQIQIGRLGQDVARDDLTHQCVQAGHADRRQHGALIVFRRPDMTGHKFGMRGGIAQHGVLRENLGQSNRVQACAS